VHQREGEVVIWASLHVCCLPLHPKGHTIDVNALNRKEYKTRKDGKRGGKTVEITKKSRLHDSCNANTAGREEGHQQHQCPKPKGMVNQGRERLANVHHKQTPEPKIRKSLSSFTYSY